MDRSLKLEALMEHADWVRRLAHSLVSDPARADDVAQETWLAALNAPPREVSDLRAWLGTVVRNAAKRSVRSSRRVESREASAAKGEALPSAAELVEQADLQREIASMVIALDEPYRQTLLLRYYRGYTAEQIAQRSEIPLNTVRTRLQRGLVQLRERLDRRFGDRGTWCAALAPLLRMPFAAQAVIQGSLFSSTGALIMAAKMKWLALAAAALLGLWWCWPRETALPADVAVAADHTAASQAVIEPTQAILDGARVPLSASQTPPADAPAPPRITSRISGRCVDLSGTPLAGLEIQWVDNREPRNVINGIGVPFRAGQIKRPSVRSQIDGTFSIEHESAGGTIDLARDDLKILGATHVAEFPEILYLIAPCIRLAGSVVDSEHQAVVGATLFWEFSLKASRTFPFVTDGYFQEGFDCDSRGHFDVNRIAAVGGCKLSVSAKGFQIERITVPDHSAVDLEVVLQRSPVAVDRHIAGRVVRRDGRPVAGAQVDFGQDGAKSGDDGSFRVNLTADVSKDTPLTAFSKGARPAALLDFGEQVLARGSVIDDAQLMLDDPLAPIRGRVLDASGAPCVDWRVTLLDGQPWGTSNRSLETMAGEDVPDQNTDADGRFRFGGLLDHSYRVRALTWTTMLAVESEAFAPGSDDVILRVPADALIEKVVGRVVSRRGLPIDGASISIGQLVAEVGQGITRMSREATRADAQGRFELTNVPRNGCLIGASDTRILSGSISFDASMAGRELLLEVDLDLRFRVEPRRAGEFDRFQILDRSGTGLTVVMHLMHAESSIDTVSAGSDGRFPICSTNEAAESLVLYLGDVEVRRVPLALRPGEITVVSP